MQWLRIDVIKGLFCVAMFAGANVSASENKFSDLIFYTEDYPPANYAENNQAKGYAVDILIASAKAVDQELNLNQITISPWSFAYKETLTNPKAVLFATTRTGHREKLFNWVGPIADVKLVLIARKDANIKVNEPIDLAKYTIGVVRDDVGEQKLLSIGVPRASMKEAPYITRLVELLLKKRIDMLAFSERGVYWWANKEGVDASVFETVYILNRGYLYYALNKSIDPNIVDELQKGVNRIKSTKGEDGISIYQSIMNKYR